MRNWKNPGKKFQIGLDKLPILKYNKKLSPNVKKPLGSEKQKHRLSESLQCQIDHALKSCLLSQISEVKVNLSES